MYNMILIFDIIVYSQPIPLSKERNQFLYKCQELFDKKHKELKHLKFLNQSNSANSNVRIHCAFCNEIHEY